MNHLIVINGLDHAFMREFGCDCNRCKRKGRRANTSVSLLTLSDDGELLHHVLFDIGMGVVNSLINCPFLPAEKAKLDWLILSHWHPDHVNDLNRLCETWRRTMKRRGQQWKSIPTWCRRGTAEWLKKNHAYELHNFLDTQVSNEFNRPGVKLDPIQLGIPGLTVTPITVSHCTADIDSTNPKEKLYCSASFVIEHLDKKVVLLWDIDNMNDWITDPASIQHSEEVKMLSKADYLYIDCNTWSKVVSNGKNTGHASFSTVLSYAQVLSPKQTFLVHISGHEDGRGNPGWGWENATWTKKAQNIWAANDLPGCVCVPSIGQKIQI